jgi:hypothetical protein
MDEVVIDLDNNEAKVQDSTVHLEDIFESHKY